MQDKIYEHRKFHLDNQTIFTTEEERNNIRILYSTFIFKSFIFNKTL